MLDFPQCWVLPLEAQIARKEGSNRGVPGALWEKRLLRHTFFYVENADVYEDETFILNFPASSRAPRASSAHRSRRRRTFSPLGSSPSRIPHRATRPRASRPTTSRVQCNHHHLVLLALVAVPAVTIRKPVPHRTPSAAAERLGIIKANVILQTSLFFRSRLRVTRRA